MTDDHGTLYVLAGTHQQARDAMWTDSRRWQYVHDARLLLGTRSPRVLRVGTWWERPDLDYVESVLLIAAATKDDADGR